MLGLERGFRCHAYVDSSLAFTACKRDSALRSLYTRLCFVDQRGYLGYNFINRSTDDIGFSPPNQMLSGTVEDRNTSFRIETDHACAYPSEYSFSKSPTLINLIARTNDIVVLGSQFLSHLVETLTQVREVAFGSPHRHLCM